MHNTGVRRQPCRLQQVWKLSNYDKTARSFYQGKATVRFECRRPEAGRRYPPNLRESHKPFFSCIPTVPGIIRRAYLRSISRNKNSLKQECREGVGSRRKVRTAKREACNRTFPLGTSAPPKTHLKHHVPEQMRELTYKMHTTYKFRYSYLLMHRTKAFSLVRALSAQRFPFACLSFWGYPI